MRYENWDVILFPEGSRVPIQEFKTRCFVTRDVESPYSLNQSLSMSPFRAASQSLNQVQLPVLTAFIPSLPHNSPFRVSVHSWERPHASRLMEGLMQPDDAVVYEVRVFIDGICVSGSIFNQRTPWPHVINLSSQIDKNGNQDNLRFPQFHQEILQQSHWDASDMNGRIKIVIAEGFSRPHRSPPFERVADIVAFSFQHAPLNILEYSKIAWPNAGMWYQTPHHLYKCHSGNTHVSQRGDEDAHAHSPVRHGTSSGSTLNSHNMGSCPTWPYRLFPPPSMQWQPNPPPERQPPKWPQNPPVQDPFVDPFKTYTQNRRLRSTLDDVPMPDYVGSSSASSRAISNMTGISYEAQKAPSVPAAIDDEQYNQLIEAFSPSKKPNNGTHAPTNTPSSVPPIVHKPSAAAEARTASYSRGGGRPTVLREISQPLSRDPSGSSRRSSGAHEALGEPLPVRRVGASPSTSVRSRKEELAHSENKENDGEDHVSAPPSGNSSKAGRSQQRIVVRTDEGIKGLSDSKRKRSSGAAAMVVLQTDKDHTADLSPSKKVSRVRVSTESMQSGSFQDFLEHGTPLDLAEEGSADIE
ncbi:hypothetical protein FQN54_006846 [Arachnomyces sp. PD_36]|nr:hypothetical protein FQN54_006846 [Arachnomyces sp. PD_36]